MNNDGAQKIALVLGTVIDKAVDTLKVHTSTLNQDIILSLQDLHMKVGVLEKIVNEKKKAPRVEKKQAEAAPATAETAPKAKLVPTTISAFFREKYVNDAEFRAKVTTKEMQEKINKNPDVAKKEDGEPKLIAASTVIWRANLKNATFKKMVEEEYAAAKAAAKGGAAPMVANDQQEVEPVSP